MFKGIDSVKPFVQRQTLSPVLSPYNENRNDQHPLLKSNFRAEDFARPNEELASQELFNYYEDQVGLKKVAKTYQAKVPRSRKTRIKSIPKNFFDRKPFLAKGLIDSELPTLVMIKSFDGIEEFAISQAAQKQRNLVYPDRDQSLINVVIANDMSPKSFMWVKNKKENGDPPWNLYLKRGLIIDKKGTIYYGDFPKPIQIDLVWNTFKNDFFKSCEQRKIPLINDLFFFEVAQDKVRSKSFLKTYAKQLGFNVAEALTINKNDLGNKDILLANLENFIAQFPAETNFVLKPHNSSGGNGVEMISKPFAIKDIYEKVESTLNEYDTLMLEPWIESFPIYSEEDKSRYDWNFRIIANPNQAFLTEARIHFWGNPVNKAQGAMIRSFRYIDNQLKKAGISETDIQELNRSLGKLAKELAKAMNSNYLGLDVIIDKNLQPWIIELNSGQVGGMRSLIELDPFVLNRHLGMTDARLFTMSINPKIMTRIEAKDSQTYLDKNPTNSPHLVSQMLLEIFDSLDIRSLDQLKQKQDKLFYFFNALEHKMYEGLKPFLLNQLLLFSFLTSSPGIQDFVLKKLDRYYEPDEFSKHFAELLSNENSKALETFFENLKLEPDSSRKAIKLQNAVSTLLNFVRLSKNIKQTNQLEKIFANCLSYFSDDGYFKVNEFLSETNSETCKNNAREFMQLIFDIKVNKTVMQMFLTPKYFEEMSDLYDLIVKYNFKIDAITAFNAKIFNVIRNFMLNVGENSGASSRV